MTTRPSFVNQSIDLAQPRLGAKVTFATDDFFAPKERLINPAEPVFIAGKYDENGKWMDGWESRRKRDNGYDYCIVKICAGVIHGFDIDTSHFTGNFAPSASIDVCNCADDIPDDDMQWQPLLSAQSLSGDSHHYYKIENDQAWTHVRLNIFPDGGIARLRVFGTVTHDWLSYSGNEFVDLAAMQLGGRAIICNDMHFGHMSNLIAPGRGENMGDGWETRRRRDPGFDWVILKLGHVGTVEKVQIDTAHFKGNFPHQCSINGNWVTAGNEDTLAQQSLFWPELLPVVILQADSIHDFETEVYNIGPISHIRLNIIPDGGISRLRAFGRIPR